MRLTATRRNIIYALAAIVFLAAGHCAGCKRATMTTPPSVAETVDPWKEAVNKVEEDRGEAVGRKATVVIPEQLKHYAERRRFLAVQAADARAHVDVTSLDFADLARLIQKGELVEMKQVGANYILYGVGWSVSDAAFAHYDNATQQDITLAATDDAFKEEVQRALDAAKESANKLAQLNVELRRVPKRNRARRTQLFKAVEKEQKEAAELKARSSLLAAAYGDPKRRKSLLADYQLLLNLAGNFEGEAYDLSDPDARRRLKIRLLSFIRPEARDLLIQIAEAYKERFNRPLPVSSLVRPVQYQRELARTNANAARGPTPPHSTGFSFDLYYRYMSAAEQEYLMSAIARMEAEGLVESLRERRDHIHVYVFGTGRPPEEKLIARILASERSGKPGKKQLKKSGRGLVRNAPKNRVGADDDKE